jgi:hypothetical protein
MRLLRRIHFIPNLDFCQYDLPQIHFPLRVFDALNKTGAFFLVQMRIGKKNGVPFETPFFDFYKMFTKFSSVFSAGVRRLPTVREMRLSLPVERKTPKERHLRRKPRFPPQVSPFLGVRGASQFCSAPDCA